MTPSTGGNPISLCLSDDDGDDDDVMVTSNDKSSLQLAEIQHPLVLSLSGQK